MGENWHRKYGLRPHMLARTHASTQTRTRISKRASERAGTCARVQGHNPVETTKGKTVTKALPHGRSSNNLVRLQRDGLVLAQGQHVHGAHLLAHRLVLQRGVRPGELGAGHHGGLAHPADQRLVGVDGRAPLQAARHELHRVGVELLLHGDGAAQVDACEHVLHGVHEAARLRDHGQRAEAHGLHLREAAGLPAGGHEVEVGGAHDRVALRAAPSGEVELLGVLPGQGLRGGHQVGAARADDDELQVQLAEDGGEGREEVVVALLQVHAADEDAEGGLPGDRQAVELLDVALQRRLLPVHVLDAEGGEHHGLLDKGLVRGVDALLHAVDDAGDALGGEDVVHLHAHLGEVQQLPGVGRRDREDAVHVEGARRHPVQAALDLGLRAAHLDGHAEGEGAHRLLGQPVDVIRRLLGVVAVEATLEDAVVDEQGRLQAGPALGVRLPRQVEVDGHEGGVPVVHDDDAVRAVRVAAEGQLLHDPHGRLGKVSEAPLVVRKVLPPLRTVEHGAGLLRSLGQEAVVVHEDAVNL
mmetsp:Transcript_95477/g.298418  ORF Transcript_95477/g.298418 Transcript_95477/m.298418 type:complete len:528 (+) Transcript_95477:305-1888(+)